MAGTGKEGWLVLGKILHFVPRPPQPLVSPDDHRLARVQESLNKINRLLTELKQLAKTEAALEKKFDS